MATPFEELLRNLAETSCAEKQNCFTFIRISFKDRGMCTIRIDAYPDTHVFWVQQPSIILDGTFELKDWDHEVDLLLSCAYNAYQDLLRARVSED